MGEAREYVRQLRLTGQPEYHQWRNNGHRPGDIPSNPDVTYKGKGWVSWQDWLGYGEGRLPSNEFLPFEDARQYVRDLRLTGAREYRQWNKSGQRPDNIPSCPERTYRSKGWVSWPDWLGYEHDEGVPVET